MTKHYHDCLHYRELMTEQKKVVARHLRKYEHNHFKNLQDVNSEAIDFINKFAGIMREVYCDLCGDNKDCRIYKKDLEGLIV